MVGGAVFLLRCGFPLLDFFTFHSHNNNTIFYLFGNWLDIVLSHHRIIMINIVSRKKKLAYSTKTLLNYYCQNISLYEPEQSLSLSQDEGEQC